MLRWRILEQVIPWWSLQRKTMSHPTMSNGSGGSFPQLAHPPIVEAVIHWVATPEKPLDPEKIETVLSDYFPDFTTRKLLHQIELRTFVSDKADESIVQQRKAWDAFRLDSNDKKYVIQFKKDGLAFSQTKDYEDWQHFIKQAAEAWAKYVEIAAPLEVQRLGVRFINRIPNATPENLEEFLYDPPTCPSSLPLKEFVYQSTFELPDLPFGIRVIKVMQPSMPELKNTSGLILDIDVYTTSVISTNADELEQTMAQIRQLKNQVFFTLVNDPVRHFGEKK